MKRAAKDESFGKPNAGDQEPNISNVITVANTPGKFSNTYPFKVKLTSCRGRVMSVPRSIARDPGLSNDRNQNLPSHSQPDSSENGCRCC